MLKAVWISALTSCRRLSNLPSTPWMRPSSHLLDPLFQLAFHLLDAPLQLGFHSPHLFAQAVDAAGEVLQGWEDLDGSLHDAL